jgi:hypothetical protein
MRVDKKQFLTRDIFIKKWNGDELFLREDFLKNV